MELISISKKEASQYNARLIEASQENPKRKKFWGNIVIWRKV